MFDTRHLCRYRRYGWDREVPVLVAFVAAADSRFPSKGLLRREMIVVGWYCFRNRVYPFGGSCFVLSWFLPAV